MPPLTMLETTIHFKPREQWRPGMTPQKLVEALDKTVALPGIADVWVPPIRNRLDMLATGIKSPVGIKVNGNNIADIVVSEGPPMLKSENARLSNWIYVDIRGRDLKSAVNDMQKQVAEQVTLPQGVSLSWSGQFEYLERATATLKIVLPVTIMIIFLLLWLTFKRLSDVLIIMGILPFALIGGVWLLWFLEYNLSVAGAVGFIALPAWRPSSASSWCFI